MRWWLRALLVGVFHGALPCGAAMAQMTPVTPPAPEAAPDSATAGDAAAEGDAAYRAGQWADAEAAYRTAIARADQSGTSRALAILKLHNMLGLALANQRKTSEAVKAYRVAAERCVDQTDCKTFRANLARQLTVARAFDEAIALYRTALAEALAATPADPARVTDARADLAMVFGAARRHDEAITEGELALRDARAIDPRRTVIAHTGLAAAYRAVGRLDEAEATGRAGAELAARALKPADQETIRIKQELGDVYHALARLADAERYQRDALTALSRERPNDPDVPFLESALAITLIDTGKAAEAETIFRNMLARDLAKHGEQHIDVAVSRHNVANALAAQGKLDEGETEERKALAIHLALDPQGLDAAKAYENLRMYLVPKGDLATAERYSRAALAIKRKLLLPNDEQIINSLGFLARSVSRTQPGTAGLALAREARALAEGRIGGGGGGAAATLAIKRALGGARTRAAAANYVYSILMEAAAFTDEASAQRDPSLVAEVFESAQYLTVSAAGEAMTMTAARTAAGSTPTAALAARQQALTEAVRVADAELTAALARGDVAATTASRAKLAAAGVALAEVDDKLRTSFPAYADLISPRPISIAEVQAQLKPDEALLAIVHADFDIHSFLIRKDGVRWRRYESAAERTGTQIRRLLCSVDPAGCSDAEIGLDRPETPMEEAGHRRFELPAAFELYEALIAPVAGDWQGVETVYTIATGKVANLPFNMLVTADPGSGDDADPARLRGAAFMGERLGLITLPSISSFRSVGVARAAIGDGTIPFLGYGDPVLLGDPANARSAARGGYFRAAGGSRMAMADPASLRALAPLPGTRVELDAMAALFAVRSDLLALGASATEARLRTDPRLMRADVIAFATHGLLPGEMSGLDEPGLVLTPPAVATARDDGVLAASEAAQLALRADWVILSACNTATAQGAGQTDSLSSLARAFLYAGAGALLASRWRIGDEVTAALTVETLRERRNRATPRAVALQRAMRTVRTGKRSDGSALTGWQPDWAHPAAWAPFSLISNRND